AGDRGIVDQRRLVVAAGQHVAVERVVACVASGAGEPAAVDAGAFVEDLFRLLVPVDLGRGLAPESLRVALPARVGVVIPAGAGVHRPSPVSWYSADCGTSAPRKQGCKDAGTLRSALRQGQNCPSVSVEDNMAAYTIKPLVTATATNTGG